MGTRIKKVPSLSGGPTADVFPPPVLAKRAPESTDINFPNGQMWIDQSVTPDVIYFYTSDGSWQINTTPISTDGTFASPNNTTVPSTLATKTYVDAVAVFGAPIADEVTQGIGYVASDAEAIARQANTPSVEAFFLTPANLDPIFASIGAPIGSVVPDAATFTDLTADGTGVVSLGANAASDFTVTGASADLTLQSIGGSVNVLADEAVANAIRLNASDAAGGIDVDCGSGGFLVDAAAGAISLDSALASNFTVTGAADVTLQSTAGAVNVISGEANSDSINVTSSGGMSFVATGAAGKDIVATCTSGSIHLTAGEAVSDALNIDSSGGFDLDAVGEVNLTSSQAAATALHLVASDAAGGLTISTGTGGILPTTSGKFTLVSTDNASQSIYLHANGGTSETVQLHADQGTGVTSVYALSDVGGITLRSGLASADAINIEANGNAAGGLDIDAGTNGVIVDTTGAISLDGAAASNLSVTGAGVDISVVSASGSININAGEAAADAINVDSTGGLDVDVALQMNLDSSQAAVDAVRVRASNVAGGIDVDCGTGGITVDSTGAFSIDGAAASNVTVTGAGIDLTLSSVLGSVLVSSTENAAQNIYLHSDGGTSETIKIHSDQGTGVASLNLLSDVGGITLRSGLGSADAINIEANGNAGGGLDVDAGTAGVIVDTTGAISLDAAAASNFTATGAFDVTVSSTAGSVIVSGGEAVADAIQLTCGSGSGGITAAVGSGNFNVSGGNLVLSSVATQLQLNGGAATDFIGTGVLVAGVGVILNTNIAATDRIFLSRTAVNASTTLGELTYTISAATSFTVTSVILGTPGSTQTGDVSSFAYFIVRQN